MRSRQMLAGVLLVALVAAGCGSKPAETKTPQGTGAPQQETTTPTTPAVSSSGTKYAAVAGESTASYAVREKFLGRELNATAVGESSAFTGEIILDGGVIQPSVVQVDLSTLKSDEERRDNQVRRALDTANHPFATFQITGAEGNPVLKEGQEVSLKLQGKMTIKGTEQPLLFDARARLEGESLALTAETTFQMTTFGVTPPNIANFVSVTDEVKLTISFVGKKQ